MLEIAKILHAKGFLITFLNNEFKHQRLVRSQGSDTLSSFSSFRFETIPDGLPPPDNKDATHDVNIVLKSLHETRFTSFKSLVSKINASDTPGDLLSGWFPYGFHPPVVEELGIPDYGPLGSQGSDTLSIFSSFRFKTIPDGLPPPDNKDATHDVNIVLKSLHETRFTPFKRLVSKINASDTPGDLHSGWFPYGFHPPVVEELGIPDYGPLGQVL
uniref:7-deoxyloganetin glucosyltransferase-like n=1 Tax=Tanacetum cinerariifolium TaxID=118510 RepID=A0A699HZX7_TANCI|nr:7-deoxyloganetin glucosyltransferase-like [Tanacetum cinerariifolium]